MFKKLRQKINEEQLPVRSSQAQGPPKRTPPSTGSRSRTSSFSGQHNEGTFTPSDRELLAEMIAEPAFLSEYTIFALESTKRPKVQNINVNVFKTSTENLSSPKLTENFNDDSSVTAQKPEMQTFAQKLQLRVPSIESLFRASSKETLFPSPSKESLVRSASRESLNRLDADVQSPGSTFDPSSDIESEAEDSTGNFESLSKDPSSNQFRRMERSLGNYRLKYSELVTAYRTLQRDKEKMQVVLSQGQDKALRRIGELREELQMDQQAKKHIQDEFEAALEEKDQFIGVLQTQVSLLKQRMGFGGTNTDLQESTTPASMMESTEAVQESPNEEENNTDSPDGLGEGGGDANSLTVLQKRVKRQENLLQRCKEMIHTHKERCIQMTSEKEALQEQLDERYQELEKIKDLHTAEKTKLITHLRDAKNLIEQLEQDKGMVIAETKRQMHETLEMKEEEISQLRARFQQFSGQREELLEQKEKSDKAAFEELEKALVAAQRSEDRRKKLKQEMEKQKTALEQSSEEQQRSLQQELTRVKLEMVNVLKSSEDRIEELEKSHLKALKCKEEEFEQQLQTSQHEFQEQLKKALDKCNAEHQEQQQEREQQTVLALEDQELQRQAVQGQAAKQIQELQAELETFKTRVLELESLLLKKSQDGEAHSEELEMEKAKYKLEITALIKNHEEALENIRQEEEQLWTEKMQVISHQHKAKLEELEKKSEELEVQLKEKETQFHAHIEEMNQKTLEKLDVKQTELEALSTDMTEMLKLRQELENKLATIERDYEKDLENKKLHYEEKIETAKKDVEQSFSGVEKALTDELNNLHHLLEGKDKIVGDLQVENQHLINELEKVKTEIGEVSANLEFVSQARQKEQEDAVEKLNRELDDQRKLHEMKLTELQNLLKNLETEKEKKELSDQTRLNELTATLDDYKSQAQEVRGLEEKNSELLKKVVSLTEKYETQITQLGSDIAQLQKILGEKQKALNQAQDLQKQQADAFTQKQIEDQNLSNQQIASLNEEYGKKIKALETKLEQVKQKRTEMQDKFKMKLSEQEIKLKTELEKQQKEFVQKEQTFNEKLVEMAHATSAGINETVVQLESNHKQQLESLNEVHKQEIGDVKLGWEKRLDQQLEELQEKHEIEFQEKQQELRELKQNLESSKNEKEELSRKITELGEEVALGASKLQQLQGELKETLVQIDTLTESETALKAKLQTFEETNSQSLLERTALESHISELKKSDAQSQDRIHELSSLLKEAEDSRRALENIHCKETEEYEKQLKERSVELQNESEIRSQVEQLINCFNEANAKVKLQTNDFHVRCTDKMNILYERIKGYQSQIEMVQKAFVQRTNRVGELEIKLEEVVNQNVSLNNSVQHMSQQLHNEQQNVMALQSELQSITAQLNTVQQERKHHSQVLDEKETCIEQYRKDLSESVNAHESITEQLKKKELLILSLEEQISDLKLQLDHSVRLSDQEEAISSLNKQQQLEQQKLQHQIDQLAASIETVSKEKVAALEQADQYKSKLTEWKKKMESRLMQHNGKMKELESKFETSVKANKEKDHQVSRLTAEVEKLTTNAQSVGIEFEYMTKEKEKIINDLNVQLEATKSRIAELDRDIAAKSEECTVVDDLNKQLHQKEIELQEMGLLLGQAQAGACDQDSRCKAAEEKIEAFEKQVELLQVEFSQKQNEWEQIKFDLGNNKEKELTDLETRMKAESTTKIAELKKKAEQKIARIKKQLTNQLDEKEKCMNEQIKDLKRKAGGQEETIGALKENLKSLETPVRSEKEENQKWVEKVRSEMKLEKENSLKMLRESYEEKIRVLQMEVSARDELVKKCKESQGETNVEQEINMPCRDLQKHPEKVEDEKQIQMRETNQLQSELEQQKHIYSLLVEQQKEETNKLENCKAQLSVKDKQIKEMEKIIAELQNETHRKGITEKQTIVELGSTSTSKIKETEEEVRLESSSLTGDKKQIQVLQEQLEEKISLLKIFEESSNEKTKSDTQLQKLLDGMREQQNELRHKLEEAENEKQKVRKEHGKLQKDLRMLRKEHEAEIEITRKEISEEAENKTKLELEDLQLKHNSTLKQLMREFNTQLAQKEHEQDISVKETISKAQEVEAELLETHKEDVNQLYRKIAEKDDCLQRTAKKYEEILQSREEEMSAKVTEIQTQLEELQAQHQLLLKAESQNMEQGHPLTVTDLQAQLGQKTTLVNDARLQEQELREQIHSHRDRLRVHEKIPVCQPFGTPYKDGNYAVDGSRITEPTELEYLKKVLFEYMMGKETKTLAKVITTVLKFPADQTQKILEREDSRTTYCLTSHWYF
ncbi:golgin subfamily A member 4 isoform X2 [Scyliorhinus canicula]|uniref:golgin subfamily A member 4 isoform X2 n=1 Tax=Scyliorhinus canicula TaxID=7830 RepID=UPI0018F31D01|nr:golgin subfamily A member 4 isoform X2 [Scyliorhinus canicula]